MTDVKERPILFSGPMIRAIRENRKTQTRRVINVPVDWKFCDFNGYGHMVFQSPDGKYYEKKSRYGIEGDRLWVRETFVLLCAVSPVSDEPNDWGDRPYRRLEEPTQGTNGHWHYNGVDLVWRADGWIEFCDGDGFSGDMADKDDMPRWKPSIHMPRSFSRETLSITEKRVERIHAISNEDAIAEGAHWFDLGLNNYGQQQPGWTFKQSGDIRPDECFHSAKLAFGNGWNSINAKRGFGFASRCWVEAITFKRLA